MTPSRLLSGLALLAAGLSLPACATAPGSGADRPPGPALGASWPDDPADDVIGAGLVLDKGGHVSLCLGPVAESAPPQCSGIPLADWSWEGVEGVVEVEGARWGSYAVQGTYDGEMIRVTQPPVLLALYDPMMPPDPTEGRTGSLTDGEAEALQEELPTLLGDAYLGSHPEDGWLWVDVLWDDGTWQEAADADYGTEKVVVRSALREVG